MENFLHTAGADGILALFGGVGGELAQQLPAVQALIRPPINPCPYHGGPPYRCY